MRAMQTVVGSGLLALCLVVGVLVPDSGMLQLPTTKQDVATEVVHRRT
jgi:hypothetical protein